MGRRTIIDNEHASLFFDEEAGIVHHHFKGFIHADAFREVLSAGAELLEKTNATKWLSDDRLNSVLPEEDEQWAINVWSPRVIKAGWKHWAVVLPAKVLGQMNMKRFIKMYADLGVNARPFDDLDAALAWLEAQ